MIQVKIFGSLRHQTKIKELSIQSAHTVADLLVFLAEELTKKITEQNGVRQAAGEAIAEPVTLSQLRQCVVYVNEIHIGKLRLFKTRLADGDTVSLLSQAAGG